MRLTRFLALAFVAVSISRSPAFAADPQIQSIAYDPDRVVPLQAAAGFATVVELSPDEQVENIVVGNSGGWQVTANKRGDHIIVKPFPGASVTDCVVTTGSRRYVFLLQLAYSSSSAPFVIRFAYPAAQPQAALPATPVAGYDLRGATALFPITISDDGQRTSIIWPIGRPIPATFASDGGGNDKLVNGRMVGGAFVVEGIASRYVFRLGPARAFAIRRLAQVDQ